MHLFLSLGLSKTLSRLIVVITATTSVSRGKQIRIFYRAELHSDITTRRFSIVNGIPIVSIVTAKTIRRIGIEIFVRRKITNTITIILLFILLYILLGVQHPLSIFFGKTVANSIDIYLNVAGVVGRTPGSTYFITKDRTQISIYVRTTPSLPTYPYCNQAA